MREYCKQPNKKLTMVPDYILHDTVKGRRFLVMEYIDKSVEEYLAAIPLGPERYRACLNVFIQMIQAIEAMHKKTLHLHRDIKTSNFRMKGDTLYLIDFGLIGKLYNEEGNHIKMQVDQPF